MSIWIELRCEESDKVYANSAYTGEKSSINSSLDETSECWSHNNDGAGQISSFCTISSLKETYLQISKNAIDSGWIKVNKNWICPHCAKYRNESNIDFVNNLN